MLMVLLMMGTLLAAFLDSDGSHFAQIGHLKDVPILADWTQTIAIIQTAIFSTAFQFAVPSIGSITKNKKQMKGIFRNSVGFSYASNLILAVMVAVYFGSNTDPSNNLNWSSYHAGTKGWSKFVSGYIVFFAAIDGLAVFPLICVSLGDILLAGWFGERSHSIACDWKVRVPFRLLASLPQTIGALFWRDLGFLAKYFGLFTLISYSACPAVLYLASGRFMDQEGLPRKTHYSSQIFSSDYLAYALLVVIVLVVTGVVVDAILMSG
jgi:hypothetical protein